MRFIGAWIEGLWSWVLQKWLGWFAGLDLGQAVRRDSNARPSAPQDNSLLDMIIN